MNDYLKVVLGTLVWIILVPLIALPVLVLVIWKLCSLAFLYVHYNDASTMRATSMIDNSYLREGSAMIGYACKLEGFVGSLQSIQDHFYAKFLKDNQFPAFRYKMVNALGYIYQRTIPLDEFRLNDHIWERACSSEETEEESITFAMRDNGQYSWEICLLQYPLLNKSTILFKFNHFLVDATSARYLIDSFFGKKANYRIPEAGKLLQGRQWAMKVLQAPLVLLEANWKFPRKPTKRTNTFKIDDNCTQTSLYSSISTTWSFDKVKTISTFTNCKILPMFIALHLTALNRTLTTLNRPKLHEMYENLEAYFALPAPNHPILHGKSPKVCCNNNTVQRVSIPSGESECLDLLQSIDKEYKGKEEVGGALAMFVLVSLFDKIIPKMVVCYLMKMAKPEFYLSFNPFIFANDYELFGTKVRHVHFYPYLKGFYLMNGTSFCPITRGDVIDLGVAVSPDMLNSTEIELYKNFLEEELEALYSSSLSCKLQQKETCIVEV